MNIKQLKWIYTKAIQLINAYEKLDLNDDVVIENLMKDVEHIYTLSKQNDYCKNILLDVEQALTKLAKESR